MEITQPRAADQPVIAAGWSRYVPLSGIAFVVCFIGSVVASSPPSDSASDTRWIADYATSSNRDGHIATGVLLVLAGLCLLVFLNDLWTRVAARRSHTNPLPVAAAAVAAGCMAVGGVAMAATSAMLSNSAPLPPADLLRLGNDTGFAMVGIPGMLATALAVACLAVQAHAAGIFGPRLRAFSLVVAVLLLASFLFLPIAALLFWLVVVAVVLLRQPA